MPAQMTVVSQFIKEQLYYSYFPNACKYYRWNRKESMILFELCGEKAFRGRRMKVRLQLLFPRLFPDQLYLPT